MESTLQCKAASAKLLKQLSAIHGAITASPVMPILENFLFEISPGLLTITASDLQTTCTTTLEVVATGQASVAVPANILLNTLKNLPDQPISLVINTATYSVQLVSSNGNYKLSGENATGFPKAPAAEEVFALQLPGDALKKAIAQTSFSISNDELRPEMGGLYFVGDAQSSTFVATDGHTLVRYQRKDLPTPKPVASIIPRKPLQLLSTLLPSKETPVTLKMSANQLTVVTQGITLTTRLIDEQYPPYENVIPRGNTQVVSIDREELMGALRRVSIYANKTFKQVRLSIKPNQITIHAEDIDFSNEASEELNCAYDGTPIEIGFNARLLMDALNSLSTTSIKFLLADAHTAALIVPEDQESAEDILVLVMPVILREYAAA